MMTKEEKQLLLIDLCVRLPYGVICRLSAKDADVSITEKLEIGGLEHFISGTMDVKPYLRPLSSMTEEEEESLREDTGLDIFKCTVNKELEDLWATDCSVKDLFCLCSWLNKYHFDYNGLIEKGLALEAPKDMYKTE